MAHEDNPWAKEAEENTRQKSDVIGMVWKSGEHSIRILPAVKKGDVPFVKYMVHWIPVKTGKKDRPIVHGVDTKCPVCKFVSSLWSEVYRLKEEEDMTDEAPEVKKLLKQISKLRGKKTYDMNILDRDDYRDEKGKIKIKRLVAGPTIWKPVIELGNSEKWGNPSASGSRGYDLTVTVDGEGIKREYTILPDPERKPLTEDELKALETAYDLKKLRKFSNAKDIIDILENSKPPLDTINIKKVKKDLLETEGMESGDDDEDEEPRKKRTVTDDADDEDADVTAPEDDEDETPPPSKKSKKPVDEDEDEDTPPPSKKGKKPPVDEDDDADEDDEDEDPKAKAKAKKEDKKEEKAFAKDDDDEDEDESPKGKKSKDEDDDDNDDEDEPKSSKSKKSDEDEDSGDSDDDSESSDIKLEDMDCRGTHDPDDVGCKECAISGECKKLQKEFNVKAEKLGLDIEGMSGYEIETAIKKKEEEAAKKSTSGKAGKVGKAGSSEGSSEGKSEGKKRNLPF